MRIVLRASRCASLAWAVRITNSRTPAPSSQDSISSFMTRCSVRRRSEAPPGKAWVVRVDAVLHRRCAQDPELRRQIVGQAFDDDRVAAERQVGAVLLGRAHRHDQRRAARAAARAPRRGSSPSSARGVRLESSRVVVGGGGAAPRSARPRSGCAARAGRGSRLGACAAGRVLLLLWPARGLAPAGARRRARAAWRGHGGRASGGSRRSSATGPSSASAASTAASERLAGDLHAAYHRAERLAEAAAPDAAHDRAAAFDDARPAGAAAAGPR